MNQKRKETGISPGIAWNCNTFVRHRIFSPLGSRRDQYHRVCDPY